MELPKDSLREDFSERFEVNLGESAEGEKTLDRRTAITAEGAKQLMARGHFVLIEMGASVGSSFSDENYRASGYAIAQMLANVWSKAELLAKLKDPHDSEFGSLGPTLSALITYTL